MKKNSVLNFLFIIGFIVTFIIFPTKIHAMEEDKGPMSICMMKNTFQIIDTSSSISGTFFILVHEKENVQHTILVTAGHVLEKMVGENAILNLRIKKNDGTYDDQPTIIPIKNNGKVLWVRHPELDIAVMKIDSKIMIPILNINDTPALFTWILSDEGHWKNFEIYPGDKVFCVGFPYGQKGIYNFPILRSGIISSYPIQPIEKIKTFEIELKASEGYSGGPVFLYKENIAKNKYGNSIIGILTAGRSVISRYESKEKVETLRKRERIEKVVEDDIPLDIITVIHAKYIKETIDELFK